nr:MAG TPA: hypothetical protein [Caudoviricetes sp.]
MTLKEFLENNKEELIYDFVNKELKKILARSKELNKKMKALPDKNSVEGLNILVESQHLAGKMEGINLVMEELERLAKIS